MGNEQAKDFSTTVPLVQNKVNKNIACSQIVHDFCETYLCEDVLIFTRRFCISGGAELFRESDDVFIIEAGISYEYVFDLEIICFRAVKLKRLHRVQCIY